MSQNNNHLLDITGSTQGGDQDVVVTVANLVANVGSNSTSDAVLLGAHPCDSRCNYTQPSAALHADASSASADSNPYDVRNDADSHGDVGTKCNPVPALTSLDGINDERPTLDHPHNGVVPLETSDNQPKQGLIMNQQPHEELTTLTVLTDYVDPNITLGSHLQQKEQAYNDQQQHPQDQPSQNLQNLSHPTKKQKRKKQEEFTISQRLAILDQLSSSDAPSPSIQDLATRYNTTKTSIYRWKRDRPRLIKLLQREGKGEFKRAALKRKFFQMEYTAKEKLAVVKEYQSTQPPISVKEVARKHRTTERSVYRWIKEEAKLTRLVEEEGRGDVKREKKDGLWRIKTTLQQFYEENLRAEQPLKMTGGLIARKAKEAKEKLLAEHAAKQFLTEEEEKAIQDFQCSEPWGRKMGRICRWKSKERNINRTPERFGVVEGEVCFVDNIASAASHSGMGTIGGKTTASSRKNKNKTNLTSKRAKATRSKKMSSKSNPNTSTKKELHKQIQSLKSQMQVLHKTLHDAELKVQQLENENDELRHQLSHPVNMNAALPLNESMNMKLSDSYAYNNGLIGLDDAVDEDDYNRNEKDDENCSSQFHQSDGHTGHDLAHTNSNTGQDGQVSYTQTTITNDRSLPQGYSDDHHLQYHEHQPKQDSPGDN